MDHFFEQKLVRENQQLQLELVKLNKQIKQLQERVVGYEQIMQQLDEVTLSDLVGKVKGFFSRSGSPVNPTPPKLPSNTTKNRTKYGFKLNLDDELRTPPRPTPTPRQRSRPRGGSNPPESRLQ